jgi:hypothetical protein
VTVEHVREYLKAMQHAGLIVLFESGGRMWQHWAGFNHNQVGLRDNRETTDFATPPAKETDESPKGDAGEPPTSRQDDGNLPASIRQTAGEMSAEKNRSELNVSKEGDADAPPAVTYEAKDEDNMTTTPPPTRIDPVGHAFDWMTKNDKSVTALRSAAKSETALDASLEFYRVSGIKVLSAKSRLAGGAALYEACSGRLDLIEKAYKQLTDGGAFVGDEWSLVKTCNVLASTQPPAPSKPTREIVEWRQNEAGEMYPVYADQAVAK